MKKKILEKKINKLLNVLTEAPAFWGPTPKRAGDPVADLQPNVPAVRGTTLHSNNTINQTGQVPPQQNVQQPLQTEVPPTVQPEDDFFSKSKFKSKLQFLNTPTLFSSQPPADSASWKDEKKEYYSPIVDGRLGQALLKHMKFFKPTGSHGAARYGEYQFRIILRGSIKIDSVIEVIAKKDDRCIVKLKEVSMETPHGFEKHTRSGGTGDASGWSTKLKDIRIQADNYDIFEWAKKKLKAGENPINKGEVDTDNLPDPDQPKKELLTKVEQQTKKGMFSKLEMLKRLSPEERSMAKAVINEIFRWQSEFGPDRLKVDLDDEATLKDIVSKSKQAVKDGKSTEEAGEIVMNNYYRTEGIDLSKYLKALLLTEAKTPRNQRGIGLERELGGRIIAKLNDKIFDAWFGINEGIAANTFETYFEGNIFEFFAADKATFRPTSRNVTDVKEDQVTIEFNGEILVDGEIWIDARVGEKNNRLDTWTFRDHDKPNKPFLIKTFGLGKVVPTVIGRRKPGNAEVKNVNPKGNLTQKKGGIK